MLADVTIFTLSLNTHVLYTLLSLNGRISTRFSYALSARGGMAARLRLTAFLNNGIFLSCNRIIVWTSQLVIINTNDVNIYTTLLPEVIENILIGEKNYITSLVVGSNQNSADRLYLVIKFIFLK